MVKDEEKIANEGSKEEELGLAVKEEELIEPEEIVELKKVEKKQIDKFAWQPRTEIGKKVKGGEITNIDEILDKGIKILEPEIVDILLPEMEVDLLLIGQSKGKFGGGQRRVFKQTQKKTKEGNKPKFSTFAIIGNKDGYVGLGYGKAKETVPAREKAIRRAKLNIMRIKRGCGSWECRCKQPHTVPVKIEGKCGSVKLVIMPAPKGTGLCAEPEIGKILKIAGITDVWAKATGQARVKLNLIEACNQAFKKLARLRMSPEDEKALGVIEGKSVSKTKEDKEFLEQSLKENKDK